MAFDSFRDPANPLYRAGEFKRSARLAADLLPK
jgi:hypothetical protein